MSKNEATVYQVRVEGELGLKTYHVAVYSGSGLKGVIEAKEMGEEAYRRELEKAKDNVKALEPVEVKLVRL